MRHMSGCIRCRWMSASANELCMEMRADADSTYKYVGARARGVSASSDTANLFIRANSPSIDVFFFPRPRRCFWKI